MKERPILFSGPMVQALLADRKTQTRRVVKAPRGIVSIYRPFQNDPQNVQGVDKDGLIGWYAVPSACPYGKPGDRLWVRETFAEKLAHTGKPLGWAYRADGERADYELGGGKWRPSIFMPRAACRLELEVAGVRVERIQEISDRDCIAEGVASPRPDFPMLWDSINLARGLGWATNPWVWAVEFRRLDMNNYESV